MSNLNHDFLFELHSEEIPASYQQSAIKQVKLLLPPLLLEFLYEYKTFEIYGTSRRLIIYIQNLNNRQTTFTSKKKGPPKNICSNKEKMPSIQLIKFAEKYQAPPENVTFQMFNNTEYASLQVVQGGNLIKDTISELLQKLISSIKFPKVMKWEQMDILYPRPIKYYICMHGSNHINLAIHPFFQKFHQKKSIYYTNIQSEKNSISLENSSQYILELKKINIIVNPDKRKQYILQQLEKETNKINPLFSILLDDDLLNEVNFLVEHPSIIVGNFPEKFLDLPDKLILSEMQEHQKYFSILDSHKKITNSFLIIANIPFLSKTATQNIRTGNERVLNAKLSDATFFFEEDMKTPLIKRVDKLKDVSYIQKRGTLFDKKERIKLLANEIILQNPFFFAIKESDLTLACDLIKTDLTTQLVQEFEHLQGYVGSIYAKKQGISEHISTSIKEHYLPISVEQNIQFPTSNIGIILSIADKLDNILIAFSLGKEPKSNQDPLGIRRQSLAIIYICLEYKLNLHFDFTKFSSSFLTSQYILFLKEICPKNIQDDQNACLEYLTNTIWDFISKRLNTIFEKKEYPKKILPAALHTNSTDILDVFNKLNSLLKYYYQPDFEIIMSVFTRMNNIVQKSSQPVTKKSQLKKIDTTFFVPQENAIYQWFKRLESLTSQNIKNYDDIFLTLIQAKELVINFFDHVMVNHDDPKIKDNRLSLLNSIILSISPILNLNKLK